MKVLTRAVLGALFTAAAPVAASTPARGQAPAAALADASATAAAAVAPPAAPPAPDATRDAVRKMNVDLGKIVSPNGIDAAEYVTLGHARQWITIRGQDRSAPLLIVLHGGPGGAYSDLSYLFQRPWEDYFTVVQWDQRGFGRSNVDGARLKGTINLEQYMADLTELIEGLRKRFGQRKVFILGQSWGTVMALEMAHRRPDLLYAVADIGQVVDERENFEETRRLFIADARTRGDAAMAKAMQDAGPFPPATDWERYSHWLEIVQGPLDAQGRSWRNSMVPEGWHSRTATAFLVSPASAIPREKPVVPFPGGFEAAQRELITSVDTWSAYRNVGTTFKVPVIIFAGRYDWQTPITLARRYFDAVCAPYKVFAEFPNSAHVVHSEEPGRMIVTLVEKVLPAAEGRTPPGARTCSAASR